MESFDLIAASAFGLEAVVARELRDLGYQGKGVQPGWTLFQGDWEAVCRANTWLRAADRVLLRVGEFEAKDFGQLFDQTRELPWERWIGPQAAFPVNGRSVRSQLSSVPACQRSVKKAIVERLKKAHQTQTLDEIGPLYQVEASLLKDRVTLTIDTTGASLHKRGYRTLTGPAPLKETLAAAMVLLSFWRPERTLVDPFCGSGTIPIEAAMIARNMAPGAHRRFSAQSWPQASGELWRKARQEALDAVREETSLHILGGDLDPQAIQRARRHARQAGVQDQIQFYQQDIRELTSRREYGCMIANPPYGERLGEDQELDALYAEIAAAMKRLETWSHYVLTSHQDFEQIVGASADRRRKLYNGRIECVYYQHHGPRPEKRTES